MRFKMRWFVGIVALTVFSFFSVALVLWFFPWMELKPTLQKKAQSEWQTTLDFESASLSFVPRMGLKVTNLSLSKSTKSNEQEATVHAAQALFELRWNPLFSGKVAFDLQLINPEISIVSTQKNKIPPVALAPSPKSDTPAPTPEVKVETPPPPVALEQPAPPPPVVVQEPVPTPNSAHPEVKKEWDFAVDIVSLSADKGTFKYSKKTEGLVSEILRVDIEQMSAEKVDNKYYLKTRLTPASEKIRAWVNGSIAIDISFPAVQKESENYTATIDFQETEILISSSMRKPKDVPAQIKVVGLWNEKGQTQPDITFSMAGVQLLGKFNTSDNCALAVNAQNADLSAWNILSEKHGQLFSALHLNGNMVASGICGALSESLLDGNLELRKGGSDLALAPHLKNFEKPVGRVEVRSKSISNEEMGLISALSLGVAPSETGKKWEGQAFQNLALDVLLDEKAIQISKMSSQFLGGKFGGHFHFERESPFKKGQGRLEFSEILLSHVLTITKNNSVGPVEGALSGVADFESFGEDTATWKENLLGKGELLLTGGKYSTAALLKLLEKEFQNSLGKISLWESGSSLFAQAQSLLSSPLAKSLGLQDKIDIGKVQKEFEKLKHLAFSNEDKPDRSVKDLKGLFRIEKQKLFFESSASGQDGVLSVNAVVSEGSKLEGRGEFLGSLLLKEKLLQQSKHSEFLLDSKGQLVLPFSVSGTLGEPLFKLESAQLEENLKAKAKVRIEGELNGLVDQILGSLSQSSASSKSEGKENELEKTLREKADKELSNLQKTLSNEEEMKRLEKKAKEKLRSLFGK
jgi:hypothetical protein